MAMESGGRVEARAEFSIEFGHLYVEELRQDRPLLDFLSAEIETVRSWTERLEREGRTFSLTCLVDDYENRVDRAWAVERVVSEYAKAGVRVNYIGFERDCAATVPVLISNLAPRNRLAHDGQVDFVRNTSRSQSWVTLAEPWIDPPNGDETYFNCSALATVWELARFGVEPYHSSLELWQGEPGVPFAADSLLTILPSRYISVESTVLDLISSIQPRILRKLVKRMGWVLY